MGFYGTQIVDERKIRLLEFKSLTFQLDDEYGNNFWFDPETYKNDTLQILIDEVKQLQGQLDSILTEDEKNTLLELNLDSNSDDVEYVSNILWSKSESINDLNQLMENFEKQYALYLHSLKALEEASNSQQ